MRQQAAVCPPVLSNGTKKEAFGRKLMLGNCSFCSGPFWVKLHWTQHGFGFSVCCVIRPWPAFCAPDPCPISSEPNETISPVHSVLSLLVQSLVRNDYLSQIFKLPVSSLYTNFHTQWYAIPWAMTLVWLKTLILIKQCTFAHSWGSLWIPDCSWSTPQAPSVLT